VAGCAAAWLLLRRRQPVVSIGVAWFFCALLPVSGVVDLLYPALMADRYLYIPLVGAALATAGAIPGAAAWLQRRLPSHPLAGAAAAGAALVACAGVLAVVSAGRVPAWNNQVTLWEEARRGAPANSYVLNGLGWSYRQAGRLGEAEPVLQQAAALAPEAAEPKMNLAAVAFLRGDGAAAMAYTEAVLRVRPGHPVALRFLGVLFEAQGRRDLAIESMKAAVAANPSDELSRRCLSDLEAAGRQVL
jgi:tetratricopeptide (TPR) repeat protein